jgi:hypothetical protein
MYKVYTYSFNNPKYLEYQSKTLKKFSVEPFEFICIDNSIDPSIRQQLNKVCADNGIRYEINQKPDHSLAGTSHYSALQWSYNEFMMNDTCLSVILDHDTFPIKSFSILEMLNGADIAGILQQREYVKYLHPCMIILDLNKLPNKNTINFNGQKVDNVVVDIGGQLGAYFRDNPNVKINYFKRDVVEKAMDIIPDDLKRHYSFEIIGEKFLHTRLGSNWCGINKEQFNTRNNFIYSMLDKHLL